MNKYVEQQSEITSLEKLYGYLDDLVCQDISSDELFASSYLRGFLSVEAAKFGDDQQVLSHALAQAISEQVTLAKTELSPQDRAIVNNYWLKLQLLFNQ